MNTNITNREKQVLDLIALGYKAKEISATLFISNDTVNTHKKNLFEKLKVRNAPSLIFQAFQKGIIH